ncbi:MAG: peptidylprolyl isomerase [Alphaproteobacteria bacterium]
MSYFRLASAFFIFAFVFCVMQERQAVAAVQEIVAVVNEDAISASDLNKRLKLILASSGLPNNAEIREKMTPQVLGGLINERIMIQEARKMGFEITPEEVDQGFATIAGQNNMSPDQFKAMMRRGGIDISTMTAQIESQVAWGKVVQAKLRPRVVVSERDIDDTYERTKAKIGTTEFLTAEIYLPMADPKEEAKVKQLGQRLVREIKSGKASFFKLAQQFSKAAGAARGGDTGWLNEEQIDQSLLNGLQGVKKNEVTAPIKTPDGYHIMFLRDTRILSEDTMPSRDQIHYNIGTDRLNKVQSRHLMDLRAAAFVDIRV